MKNRQGRNVFPHVAHEGIRRWVNGITVAGLLLCTKILLAHPHRLEENVPTHVHEVTGHKVFQGPWVIPLAILTMLVVFVGLPCLVIWGAMKAVQRLPWVKKNSTPSQVSEVDGVFNERNDRAG